MRRLDSLLLRAAGKARVPGGHALTVDREVFSAEITRRVRAIRDRNPPRRSRQDPRTGLHHRHRALDQRRPGRRNRPIHRSERLFFYDSISPIVAADSIDMSSRSALRAMENRSTARDDYINCPFTRSSTAFVDALLAGRDSTSRTFPKTRPLFRSLPAYRGDGPARPRHPALRSDEARRA